MSDPWTPPPGGQPPHATQGQPAYGQTQWQWAPMGDGLPGQIRPTGRTFLLFVVTFGIYGFVYNYQVHDEMKRHSGRGLGGPIALILTFVGNVAMPFVTPNEVSNLYKARNQQSPVSAWTGLWAIVPLVVGYIAFFGFLVAALAGYTADRPDGTTMISNDAAFASLLAAAFIVPAVLGVTGGIIWLRKTNGALNAYWQSITLSGTPTA